MTEHRSGRGKEKWEEGPNDAAEWLAACNGQRQASRAQQQSGARSTSVPETGAASPRQRTMARAESFLATTFIVMMY